MIERATPDFGRLVFDREAIVRAALRACVETCLKNVDPLGRLSAPVAVYVGWTGDLQRGAFYNGNGEGDDEVVAWTELGVVGLAYELGQGPIEQLGLSPDAVTGGPDDVRAALPGLPDELEPAFVMAVGLLETGAGHQQEGGEIVEYGEKLAGVGFWLCGDCLGGTLFEDRTNCGANRLAAWGALESGRLPRLCDKDGFWAELDRTKGAAMHTLIDKVVDRRMQGPTEFTTDEIATLLPKPPEPARLLGAQRMLQTVGITWPGSPEVPEEPKPTIDPFTGGPYVEPDYLTRCFGPVQFNRDAIVRAALRAYVETILAPLDPLARHTLPACVVPKWTGDPKRGAFFNGDGCGNYDIIAWTEAGVIGLAYKRGAAPIEQLGAALPRLPDELLPALEMAAGLLDAGAHGEKLASVGFWLHGDRTAGTLFDDPTLPGARRLVAWGTIDETGKGRLPLLGDRDIAAIAILLARTTAAPIHALIDAVTDRALKGPTEMLPDELSTLFPTPLGPDDRFVAQQMLQKAGITWPGVPESPDVPSGARRSPLLVSPRAIGRCHPLGFLVFDRDFIIRAALRAYVEVTLAYLDPRQCHPLLPSYRPRWSGDIRRGAFSRCTHGQYDVVAWSEAGVVGLAFERGPGPTEWLDPSVDPVPEGLDNARRAVQGLPDELFPTFEVAFDLFKQQQSLREKMTCVGFWLSGNRVAGTLFDTPTALGVWWLANWGRVGRGRLLPLYPRNSDTITADTFKAYAPFHAVVDAVVERALKGPTELTPDELATLFPLPPLPGPALPAQRNLQKVGITWPGSPEIPD